MQSERKKVGVLGSAAEWVEPGPYVPWFKDPEKLLRRALGDSHHAREIKRLIRKLVVDIAYQDDEFRVELGKDLCEIAKGKSHRPNTYTKDFRLLVFANVKCWKESGVVKTLPEAFAKIAEIHRSEYPELTEDAIRGIYQRERDIRKKHKTP